MHMAAPHPPRVTDLGRLLVGLTVLAIGVLFLLDSADVLHAGRAIDHWWPIVLVAAGLLTLAERPPAVTRGLVLTAIGGVLLLFTTHLAHGNAWDYLWPAAIIVAGVAVLRRWAGRPTPLPPGASVEDVVRATGVFGGPKVASSSQSFRGAWLTAIFGGVVLDLRAARPAPEGASINVTTLFGGADILVPHGWRIGVRSTPIFGGVDDKTEHDAPPPDDAPELRVDAVTIFGGVAIKHEP
jgi:predicted membrane protein